MRPPPISDLPFETLVAYAPLAAVWAAVFWSGSGVAALILQLASRVAYVGYVWWTLRAEASDRRLVRRFGVEGGFRRFQRAATVVMNNDAVAFVVLAYLTRGPLYDAVGTPLAVAAGALLLAVGLGFKAWARSVLGASGYYWYDFFDPAAIAAPSRRGPYRVLRDPMYTLGNLHAYGFALALGSIAGLGAAVFNQILIVVFSHRVERPRLERGQRRT